MTRIRYKEAIGIKVGRGRPAIGKMPDKENLKRLYIKESKSIRQVAEVMRCSKDMVHRALREHGIEPRERLKRSKLRSHDLNWLKTEIGAKGVKQVAEELGVGVTTLRDFLSGK